MNLTDEQKKRVREIAEDHFVTPAYANYCEGAILQALSEIGTQMVERELNRGSCYIDFLCTGYPQCGCKEHSKEECKAIRARSKTT